jgi:endonuclease-3 related protein
MTEWSSGNTALVKTVLCKLHAHYGSQYWWPAQDLLEMMVGAILTQATSWSNASAAIIRLKKAQALHVDILDRLSDHKLALLIQPAGFQYAKAQAIKALVRRITDNYRGRVDSFLSIDASSLREQLLSIRGIGEETADDILLYAANAPIFVIDNYTRTLLFRLGVITNHMPYAKLQSLIHRSLHSDVKSYKEYHALIVEHGKRVCRKTPLCDRCCIADLCRKIGT